MDKQTILTNVDDKNTCDCFLAALLTLLKKKSYKDVSITELCTQANFSRKTFYDHFSTKDDLLDYLADDLALGYRYTDNQSGTLHYFEFWYALKDWVSVLIENNLWDYVISQSTKQLLPLLREHEWDTMLGDYVNMKDMCIEFISAGQLRLVYLWYLEGFKKSPQELANLVNHIISGGLFNPIQLNQN